MTVIAAFLAAGVLTPQEDAASITQRIEVTRQYVPELGEAQKLDFPPRMADTVTLKPDISYAITPTPWKSVFDTEPIAPVAISTAEYRHQRPFYLMLGGGYPAQSRLDFYAAFSTPRDIRAGVYANHVGQWAKLENERGTKEPASWTENGVGLYAGRDFGTRSLDFDIRYGYNYYTTMDKVWTGYMEPENIYYHKVQTSLTFGDAFTDLSRFNYRFGIAGSLWGTVVENPAASAFADFGWKAGRRGAVVVGASFEGAWNDWDTGDWYAALVPEYRLRTDRLSLHVGVKFYYDSFRLSATDCGSHFFVLPKVGVSYELADAFIPYASLDGEIGTGNYLELAGLNPYIHEADIAGPKRAELRGGFRGDAGDVVTYDVYAGYLIGELPYFLKTGETFVPRLAPVNLFYAGAGVGLKLPMGFGLQAGVRYDSYNNAGNFWSGRGGRVGMGIPEFTVTGRASYCYRDRFSVGISVEVLGERRFASLQNLDTAVPATVNLKVDAEYKTGPRFSIFAAGDNLLNRRIYRCLGYPALGANAVAGIRMLF